MQESIVKYFQKPVNQIGRRSVYQTGDRFQRKKEGSFEIIRPEQIFANDQNKLKERNFET